VYEQSSASLIPSHPSKKKTGILPDLVKIPGPNLELFNPIFIFSHKTQNLAIQLILPPAQEAMK
jgi:hypothetical protein